MRGFLSRHRVAFISRNITIDPAAREDLRRRGFAHVPVAIVGDQAIQGYDVPALEAALGLSPSHPAAISLASLLETEPAHAVLLGVLRKLTLADLEQPMPNRGGSLRAFIHHIFANEAMVAEACRTGRLPMERIAAMDAEAEQYRSAATLAALGESVHARFLDWLRTASDDELARPLNGYDGATSAIELAARDQRHLVHHLRQLQAHLEDTGRSVAETER